MVHLKVKLAQVVVWLAFSNSTTVFIVVSNQLAS